MEECNYQTHDEMDLLRRLCDEKGYEHSCDGDTFTFVDSHGEPHECRKAGLGKVNVTVAMTPEEAVAL